MFLLYRGGTQLLIKMRALGKRRGCTMTIYYRVRAHETDTLNDTVFEGAKHSLAMAIDHAERWAAQYYGSKEATWTTSDGPGRYLLGRLKKDGTREPVTCVMTVEKMEVDDDLQPWES
jgi:hypothetical protein